MVLICNYWACNPVVGCLYYRTYFPSSQDPPPPFFSSTLFLIPYPHSSSYFFSFHLQLLKLYYITTMVTDIEVYTPIVQFCCLQEASIMFPCVNSFFLYIYVCIHFWWLASIFSIAFVQNPIKSNNESEWGSIAINPSYNIKVKKL